MRAFAHDQTVENQQRELEAVAERNGWEIMVNLADQGLSGAKGRDKRPEFDRLLKMVARKEIDLIAVWSVDRLGRSLQHLVSFLTEINEKRVDLYIHTQGLDTSTAAGRAMFSMLSVFSEFERAILVERIQSGLARSQKRNGRPPLDPEKDRLARRLLARGESPTVIAKRTRIGLATVYRIKAQMVQAA